MGKRNCYESAGARRTLLQRLGFEGNLTAAEWWAAAKSVGFTFDEFYTLEVSDICMVLEAKAAALDRAALEYNPKDAGCDILRYETRVNGGRPAKIDVNGAALKALRRRASLTQEELADKCGVSIDTLRRAEAGKGISADLLDYVAKGLSQKLGTEISPAQLQQIAQKP